MTIVIMNLVHFVQVWLAFIDKISNYQLQLWIQVIFFNLDCPQIKRLQKLLIIIVILVHSTQSWSKAVLKDLASMIVKNALVFWSWSRVWLKGRLSKNFLTIGIHFFKIISLPNDNIITRINFSQFQTLFKIFSRAKTNLSFLGCKYWFILVSNAY